MGWVINVRLRPLYLGKETRYPLYRRLGGPQGRSGRVRKAHPLPGFDPRNVQPVASRCTNWAIPAHFVVSTYLKMCLFENEYLTKAKTPDTRRIGPVVREDAPGWPQLKLTDSICHESQTGGPRHLEGQSVSVLDLNSGKLKAALHRKHGRCTLAIV